MFENESSLLGKRIDGKFVVRRHLGTGGFGMAYEASQEGLQRRVCIKFLKTDSLSSLENLNRFRREAKVLAALRHKNIVQCFSFGVYLRTYPYVAIEYVDGKTLTALLQGEPLGWRRALSLCVQVCEALEYAHSRGFVHRDIKPANILICADENNQETAKLVDFGLVGFLQPENQVYLTDPSSIIGSINYMPPEAFQGSSPDVSLDVYAFGCTMYEMLSGKVPFDADYPTAVMFKHAKEFLPALPETIPEGTRQELDKLIRKCTMIEKTDGK